MKIIAIIQARTGSTRLPGKVLLKINSKSVLEHVVGRVMRSRLISKTIVATTIEDEDLQIVKICALKKIPVFCGSMNDVLDRYYQAARLHNPDQIVRITSDCPLIDSEIIDLIIKKHLETRADYTANTLLKETYPDGEDVEIFTMASLKKAWGEARLSSEREHVTPYIRNHPEKFKLNNVKNSENLNDKRWTLDNPEDFKFIKKIYSFLYQENPNFGMPEILKLLKRHPRLELINNRIKRNEGYEKSLKEDKILKL